MLQENDSFWTAFEAKGQWYHISAFFSSYLTYALLLCYMAIKTVIFNDSDGS